MERSLSEVDVNEFNYTTQRPTIERENNARSNVYDNDTDSENDRELKIDLNRSSRQKISGRGMMLSLVE